MRNRRPGKPSLGDERNEALRALARALMLRDFGGSQTRTAQALGVTKSTFNGFLNGTAGAGAPMIDGLVAYTGRPAEVLVESGGDLDRLSARPVTVEVCFGDLPHWPDLLASAQAMAPEVPAWAWRDLAAARVWITAPVTAAMAADLARVLARHVPPHA